MVVLNKMLFKLGRVVATPAALAALEAAGVGAMSLVCRHVAGDFGEVDAHDRRANEDAIRTGERILSSYTLTSGEKLWVITEADRSSTCVLCPDDY